jgi:hypothetical protein
MEQDLPGGVVQEQAEVRGWVDLAREERVAPEQVQAQQGSVFVPNAELSHLMRLEFLAPLSNVPSVGQRW